MRQQQPVCEASPTPGDQAAQPDQQRELTGPSIAPASPSVCFSEPKTSSAPPNQHVLGALLLALGGICAKDLFPNP